MEQIYCVVEKAERKILIHCLQGIVIPTFQLSVGTQVCQLTVCEEISVHNFMLVPQFLC